MTDEGTGGDTDEDAVLDDAFGTVVRRRYGDDTRVTGRNMLSRRAASVTRLTLAGGAGVPASVIVKHLPADQFARTPPVMAPELNEEQAIYRFLDSIGACAALAPALIACNQGSLMVLEDLGPSHASAVRTKADLMPRLVQAFSRLHGRTLDRELDYLAVRHDAGLGAVASDGRHHGPTMEAVRAANGRIGLNLLAKPVIGPLQALALDQELSMAIGLVEHYSGRRCLIHDDLANARQTVETADVTYLVDFEYGRYAPPMYDLTKLILGKFEMEVVNEEYIWTSPGFPIDLGHIYRRAMAKDHGLVFSDHQWDEQMAACLIYAALTLLGNLAMVGSMRKLRAPPQCYINSVLDRLAAVLTPWCPFRSVMTAAQSVRAKVPGASA